MTTFGLLTAFWVSYVLLWFVVAVFGLLILLMFRQFGLAFMRPVDRASMQGLDLGSKAPGFSLTDWQQREYEIRFGAGANGDAFTVVVFALPTCGICAGLASRLASLPTDRPLARFVWVDGAMGSHPHRALEDAAGWIAGIANGDSVHRDWEVSAVPFCFVVDSAGRISDKRLINQRKDVELALAMTPH